MFLPQVCTIHVCIHLCMYFRMCGSGCVEVVNTENAILHLNLENLKRKKENIEI